MSADVMTVISNAQEGLFIIVVYYHFCQVKSIHKVEIKISGKGAQGSQ